MQCKYFNLTPVASSWVSRAKECVGCDGWGGSGTAPRWMGGSHGGSNGGGEVHKLGVAGGEVTVAQLWTVRNGTEFVGVRKFSRDLPAARIFGSVNTSVRKMLSPTLKVVKL